MSRLIEACNELRWNPLLGQWVVVSTSRESRPWQPGNACPFCPGSSELPRNWRTAVMPNRFPALSKEANACTKSFEVFRVRKGYGDCRVVVETSKHEGDLFELSLEEVVDALRTTIQTCKEMERDPRIRYVASFRNKGKEIGVSLTHPHSQIYALPFVPPRIRTELRNALNYRKRKSACLFCAMLSLERQQSSRVIYENKHFSAFMPFYAMWPFEVHVYSRRHLQMLRELRHPEVVALADMLRTITGGYSQLFEKPMPYIMFVHQGPAHQRCTHFHFHVEFYPALRDAKKLKYAAGIEWGAGVFTYDGLPEDRADMLREAVAKHLATRRSRTRATD